MTPKLPRTSGFFEHYEELVGTWTRRLRNRQQAEDLAHDTFVRVLESDSVTVQQPRAYLHQTARNIAVDGYRREDRRGAMESEAVDLSVSSVDDPEHYMHAMGSDKAVQSSAGTPPVARARAPSLRKQCSCACQTFNTLPLAATASSNSAIRPKATLRLLPWAMKPITAGPARMPA